MHQQNVFSSAESAAALTAFASSFGARRDSSTVGRLQSVVGELLMALTSTLNHERDSAQQSLGRAVALLQKTEELRSVAPSASTACPAPAAAVVKGRMAPWQIREVASRVETNLDKPIRSSELAIAVRLSPCHFSRVFRTSFGESPLEYITKKRIERAKQLMLSTDSSLGHIALDCGFADQAHFSRMFRRVTGDSPSAWRRSSIDPQGTDLRHREPIKDTRALDVRRRRGYDPAAVRTNRMSLGAARPVSELARTTGLRRTDWSRQRIGIADHPSRADSHGA
jgi:AraC family transcriptional regulator